jgi:hypothetical protein
MSRPSPLVTHGLASLSGITGTSPVMTRRGKPGDDSEQGVMAGLVPAISLSYARPCLPKRDHRDKPGDDNGEANAVMTESKDVMAEPLHHPLWRGSSQHVMAGLLRPSWPGSSRPSRLVTHGFAFLSGITGTSPVMTRRGRASRLVTHGLAFLSGIAGTSPVMTAK